MTIDVLRLNYNFQLEVFSSSGISLIKTLNKDGLMVQPCFKPIFDENDSTSRRKFDFIFN